VLDGSDRWIALQRSIAQRKEDTRIAHIRVYGLMSDSHKKYKFEPANWHWYAYEKGWVREYNTGDPSIVHEMAVKRERSWSAGRRFGLMKKGQAIARKKKELASARK